MIKEELSWNKVLFSSQQDQIANSQTAIEGSPTLFAPKKQIFSLLPASSSVENQIDSDSSLLPHLVRFVARFFIGCPRFHLRGLIGLIVGLVMGKTESKNADITINFSG